MNDCEHNTGTVVAEFPRFSIVKCDWGCGEYLIEIKLGNNTVRTCMADDILNRDAELEELRARLDKMVREQSEEVAEFNAGYDAFGAGMELDSAESEYRSSASAKSYDVFKIGYLYASAQRGKK